VTRYNVALAAITHAIEFQWPAKMADADQPERRKRRNLLQSYYGASEDNDEIDTPSDPCDIGSSADLFNLFFVILMLMSYFNDNKLVIYFE